jgi:hypothetical protein
MRRITEQICHDDRVGERDSLHGGINRTRALYTSAEHERKVRLEEKNEECDAQGKRIIVNVPARHPETRLRRQLDAIAKSAPRLLRP